MEVNEFTNSRFLIDINNYKIEKKHEKVGFGVVYSVKDKETGQSYAAKVIDCNYEEKKSQVVIEREISIMMRLQHPTLVKFYGFALKDFHGNNCITILMNLCKKGSLSDMLAKSRDSDDKSIINNTIREILLIGIARGMMILHQRHVIHRDLKTQNILLDQNLHPRIADYAFSKIFEIAGQLNTQSQSNSAWYYIAPEVISGNQYSGKSDVYSFGIIMYEIITNCVPYHDLEDGQINTLRFGQKVVDDDYRPKFTVPIKSSFKKLIESCWAKDPDSRPTFRDIFDKLSSIFECSIYNTDQNSMTTKNGSDDNEDNYCLDGVDVFEVRSYIGSVTEDANSVLIEELTRKVDIIFLNNIQLMKDNKALKKENQALKKENEEIKGRVRHLELLHGETIPPTQQKEDSHQHKKKQQSEQQQSLIQTTVVSTDSLKNQSEALHIKNGNQILEILLNKGFTLQFFNDLPVASQQTIVSDIVQNASNDQTNPYFTELNKLLLYFIEFKQPTKMPTFVEIEPIHGEQYHVLTKVLWNVTEMLYKNEALDSTAFIKHLKDLRDVSVETRYPSKNFKKIYNKLHKIQRSEVTELKIAIFITGVHHTDTTFAGNKHISSVRLDSSVTQITGGSMNGSFSFCTSLREVIIPSTVTLIGDCAFLGCTQLHDIKIPESVTSFGFRAFEGCSSLAHIKIPSSVKSIGWRCFKECQSLSEISIPPSVTSIGEDAFPMDARVVRKNAHADT